FDVQVTFPFVKGHPFAISKDEPAVIWFRDFDRGGMNVAFYDTGGGGGNTYRAQHGDPTSSMVTIEGGGNIGYLASGEWYIYSISVKDAGTYKITINASSGSGGSQGKYHFEIDGVKATETMPIQGSGNWGQFIDDDSFQINLPAGDHKLKFFADNGSHNPKHMTLAYISE
ncbi:MAG: carbohydrate-binding protein, partial [Bacteroidales bacterium]|nr:carbohydrate-binding protein [Bacteroidales bacterium]